MDIGQARCPHCGYKTTTGAIGEHVKHCPKNPNATPAFTVEQLNKMADESTPDCSNHKKELFGQTDMKVVAEAIGDLHYETLAELLAHLHDKIETDAFYDYVGDRPYLSIHLGDAAEYLGRAARSIQQAWQISKPHMK